MMRASVISFYERNLSKNTELLQAVLYTLVQFLN